MSSEQGGFSSRIRPVFVTVLVTVLVGGLAATLFSLFASFHWVFDLFTHFRVQYVWVFLGCSLAFGWLRQFRWVVVATLGLGINLPACLPFFIAQGKPLDVRRSSSDLRLLSFNLLSSNPKETEVLAMLRESDADVVLLMEVNHRWQQALAELKDRYPYQRIKSREDNFGIALFSRKPLDSVSVEMFSGVPSIVASWHEQGQPVMLVGTHPVPPIGSTESASRDSHMMGLAGYLAETTRPVIVAGDLNTTPFSAVYQDFIEQTTLRSSALGYGLSPTWGRPLWPLAIPIDHVLVSIDFEVLDFRVGGNHGSDHQVLIVDLRLRESPDE